MTKTKKKTTKTLDNDYFLDQILKITENLLTLTKSVEEVTKGMDRINENANFACEQLEELKPSIDIIKGRLGL